MSNYSEIFAAILEELKNYPVIRECADCGDQLMDEYGQLGIEWRENKLWKTFHLCEECGGMLGGEGAIVHLERTNDNQWVINKIDFY